MKNYSEKSRCSSTIDGRYYLHLYCLTYLCIITKDKFDAIWIEEAKVELQNKIEEGTDHEGR